MKNLLISSICLFLSQSLVFSQQDGVIDDPGDVAFVAISGTDNSDDGFSFLLMDDAPAGVEIVFSDDEYSNASNNFPSATSEGDVTWTNSTGNIVSKGTVIIITDADDNSGNISANIGTAAETNPSFGLAAGENLYAFIGTRASPTMLSMIAVVGYGGDIPNALTTGTTALILPNDGVVTYIYMGSTTCNGTLEACQMEIYTVSNWISSTGSNYPGSVPTSFDGSVLGGVLPVEFTSFTAQAERTGVMLKWQTAKEENNDYFQIEHSTDGRNFASLGQIEGKGTTNEFSDYTFFDEKPAAGINYYRLQQVDYDGAFEYSEIAIAQFGEASSTMVAYPNPFNDELTIHFTPAEVVDDRASTALLRITNLHGQVVRQETISATTKYTLDLSELAAGVYFLQVQQAGQLLTTQRLVKL